LLGEKDEVMVGAWRFSIRHVPGHSPGSLVFYQPEHRICIVGDTLFAGSVGRTDLPGGDWDTLVTNIRAKLFTLPEDTTILPGHMGPSTIGREKATNPFVGTGS
jgi:glyoxylase-like metal-dependent hydrolase (beta-lactamase superfamily II)